MDESATADTRRPAAAPLLTAYDSRRLGPLFAVSDEGSAGAVVVAAALASAKANAFSTTDPATIGVILDGERMTSAGEVPIGPDEYAALSRAAAGQVFCTTNVGVRVNARHLQPLREFALPERVDAASLNPICDAFALFVRTPDGRPRPLAVRLSVRPGGNLAALKPAVEAFEAARAEGRIGPRDLHRLCLLVDFEHAIESPAHLGQIEDAMRTAADAGLDEVAIDGTLREAARKRISVQSILNLVDVPQARQLLARARSCGVKLTYRYQLDVESAARTIWTGLHAARAHGFAAGKYGMVPLTLPEQRAVIERVTGWTRGWTAIPAFYVDTPLVTDDDVFDSSRCVEGARVWLTTAHEAGARLVLFDSPDRISPRRLLREAGSANDPGVLTLADVEAILEHARGLGVEVLWSGGITAPQAFELARRRVHGIFSTSSTARKIAVTPAFADDPGLPAESEPIEPGIRRMHRIVQAGFLASAPESVDPALASSIGSLARQLLAAESTGPDSERVSLELDRHLEEGWKAIAAAGPVKPSAAAEAPVAVPPDAVRVFRGRRLPALPEQVFRQRLGSVFFPLTVQMQRIYGLTAYLPALLPVPHPAALPDEIALVFYRTQDSYHFAKQCVGGRAYGDLHDLVFDMGTSLSGFPERFSGRLGFEQPCCLRDEAVDWQTGTAGVYVGLRRQDLAPEAFLREAEAGARELQGHRDLDGGIVCLSRDSLICWTHTPGSMLPPTPFSKFTIPVLDRVAHPRPLPADLAVPFGGVVPTPSPGDFYCMRFPRP